MKKLILSLTVLALSTTAYSQQPPGNSGGNQTKQDIEDLQERVAILESQVTQLLAALASVEETLTCASYDSTNYDLVFEGCNVHVRNGVGTTDSTNGFGNLVIGYNEDFYYLDTDRTGSHNVIIGQGHTYSSYGGFVAGFRNNVTGPNSSVSGGDLNTASGGISSVSGGIGNIASGGLSSVSGGRSNDAQGVVASVSGGRDNTASGDWSSVSGGAGNSATGEVSSVSGGGNNTASAYTSSVSGGSSNTASGSASSILGGANQSTSTTEATIPPLP